ncbi:hypothetical protein [Spirulina sp. CCNP1310]|uniref:hypothetical protein n=1 Tax=Spirulina sp. CCNP1310 TaxID=3110249 RepID=UPI002B221017|nr:hypothetical protein [Spirulina sp. CCNP1310]
MSIKRGLSLGMAIHTSAVIALLLLGGCGGEPETTETSAALAPEHETSEPEAAPEPETDPEPVAAAPANPPTTPTAPPVAMDTSGYPEIVTITELQPGDLMCYAQVMDQSGQVFEIGATFEICDRRDQLMNQVVRLAYQQENVPDCESAEPCGRSRTERLITETIILGEQWSVFSNGSWTVTVGQIETWNGQNNTGNLTYYGCDPQGNCLALSGGAITCRDGMCYMAWRNGNYTYTLASEIGEEASGDTRLLVFEGEKEILNTGGMDEIATSES